MRERIGWLSREKAIEIALFLVLLVCYTYTFPRWADWNQNSRLDVVFAVLAWAVGGRQPTHGGEAAGGAPR